MSETITGSTMLDQRPQAEAQSRVVRPVLAFLEAINRGDIDEAVRHLAPDALHHGRVSNYRPEGVRVLFGMLREAFPDLFFEARDVRVQGNRVVSHFAATGTHTGSFLGKEPTMEAVAWESIDIAEVDPETELIVQRHWDLWGDPDLWKRIGFVPAVMC
ncbi:MAG TPA: ester cyclase [Nitriliruptorales bacterium]|nr:ester cyclase [Nitriliruptorales bacterium]